MGWPVLTLSEICSSVFAGGDVPKDRLSKFRTAEFTVPIYSNGEKNKGLYGFTDIARVTEPSITVSARGTIGYSEVRFEPFLPVVRLIVLTPNLELVELEYLKYVIQSMDFKNSGSSIPQLTVPMIKNYSCEIPPISEQKRIVAILDKAFADIEQARAKTEQNLKNARELMNVAYHDAITGKLTSVWREANQTVVTASDLLKQLKAKKKELVNEKKISREKALPELSKEKVSFDLPESWAWCCLGEIGNATNYPFVDGPFGSSINTKTDYLETGVPVLRMVNVKPFMFKNYDLKYVDEDKYQQFTRHNVLPGDVLFSKVGAGTGESCVVPEDFSYGMLSTTGITRIRVGQIVLNQYLCCFLNLNIKKFMALASKAAQPFLNMTQIKTFPFPLPPIEEQSEIVLILERLSAEIQQVEAIYEQKVLALDELKKSILQKAFSGELTKTLEGETNKGAVA